MPQSFIDPDACTVTEEHAVVHLMESSHGLYSKHSFLLLEELEGNRHQIRFIHFIPKDPGVSLLANLRYDGIVAMKVFTPDTYQQAIVEGKRCSWHITAENAIGLVRSAMRQRDGLDPVPAFQMYGGNSIFSSEGSHNPYTWCCEQLRQLDIDIDHPDVRAQPEGGCCML